MFVITRTWDVEKDGKGRTEVLAVRKDAFNAHNYALNEAHTFQLPDEHIILEENRISVKAQKDEVVYGPAPYVEKVMVTRLVYAVKHVTNVG